MNRLTIMTPKGAALKMDDVYPSEDAARADLMKKYRLAVDCLAAYEDTGLEPEEIVEVQEAMSPIPFGRFHDIMEAERAGRLVEFPPNNPLTLDELREMDGELVWVVPMCGSGGFCAWMLVDAEYELCREAHGEMAVFENCGKTWTAYRRKPEEGAL